MKYYKDDGKAAIDANKSVETSLVDAMKEIDCFPTVEGNFIGFINEKDETIQFIRFEDGWLIDIPVMVKGKYAYSVQDGDLDTDKVKAIVRKFNAGEDYRSLCNLTRTG